MNRLSYYLLCSVLLSSCSFMLHPDMQQFMPSRCYIDKYPNKKNIPIDKYRNIWLHFDSVEEKMTENNEKIYLGNTPSIIINNRTQCSITLPSDLKIERVTIDRNNSRYLYLSLDKSSEIAEVEIKTCRTTLSYKLLFCR